MQNEIIYVPNVKIISLERENNFFKINISGETKLLREIEKIGLPFTEIPEFKELTNPFPLASKLEYYLRKAHIEFTLSEKGDKKIQYIGIVYDQSFCQFYLIKDKL